MPRRNRSPFPKPTFGILLHPTSLPGPEPIGTLGAEAEAWVDWLAATGAGIWQILPLTYIGEEESPYFSASAFAGNPWLIDLRDLVDAGLLDEADLKVNPPKRRRTNKTSNANTNATANTAADTVDFAAMRAWKQPRLAKAADRFLANPDHPWRADHDEFLAANADWLTDACHFFALKAADPDTPWWEWDAPLRQRKPRALAASATNLADAIEREQALQYIVERQWRSLRQRANAAGITILGDVPIYVAPDSADVWANQAQFELDRNGRQLTQAGVPPDYFSETGQLWRNPLYRWDVMADDGFAWWISRLTRALDQADLVRIDHFRGLSAYWSVPAADDTAVNGRWLTGPGQPFVDAVKQAFPTPTLPIVAEDLGDLDDDVVALRDHNNLLGMRVIQFGFGTNVKANAKNIHHPDNIDEHSIAYTGTHDNDTLVGWWSSIGRRLRERVRVDTAMPPRIRARRAARWLIATTFRTKASAVIVPLQDVLGLGTEARMNTPGTTGGNWEWRMTPASLTPELANELHRLATDTGRA